METQELDLMMAENQISFDFEAIGNEIEESSVLPETLIKSVNHDYIKEEVLFVAVRVKRDDVIQDFSNLLLCGKRMIDWVLLAGSGCKQVVIDDCEDIIDRVRRIDTDKPYIAVFYSDTPLLDPNTFYRIMDYFASKGVNYLQLTRGFIFKSEFLKNNTNFILSATSGYEDKNLLVVDNAKKINYVHNLIQNKINSFHIKNGVIIYGQDSVFIDADCIIEGGCVIYPNNIIKGNSIIENGVILESGNFIKDSIISQGVTVTRCFIEGSKITKNSTNISIINEEL